MNKRDEILAVTEGMIRERGYNAVSAREVADATSIKSSSVHYYFPKKSDMVSAVVLRYTENFLQALGARSRRIINSAYAQFWVLKLAGFRKRSAMAQESFCKKYQLVIAIP